MKRRSTEEPRRRVGGGRGARRCRGLQRLLYAPAVLVLGRFRWPRRVRPSPLMSAVEEVSGSSVAVGQQVGRVGQPGLETLPRRPPARRWGRWIVGACWIRHSPGFRTRPRCLHPPWRPEATAPLPQARKSGSRRQSDTQREKRGHLGKALLSDSRIEGPASTGFPRKGQ